MPPEGIYFTTKIHIPITHGEPRWVCGAPAAGGGRAVPQVRAETRGFVVRSGDSHCGAPEAGGGFGSELELASVEPLVLVRLWADCDQRAGAGRQEGKEGRSPLAALQLTAQQVLWLDSPGWNRFPSISMTSTVDRAGTSQKQAKRSQNSRHSDVICTQQPALRGIYEEPQAPALAVCCFG